MGKWKGIVALAVVAALVIWGLLHLGAIVNKVQGTYTAWKAKKQIEALEKPYKTDRIGGRTPEETFDLFISALKQGDIDLASKYFVLKKQESWRKTLGEYEKNNLLANFILETENSRKTWQKVYTDHIDIAEFNYFITLEDGGFIEHNGKKFPVEGGNFRNTVRFEKYPMGVWKIDLL